MKKTRKTYTPTFKFTLVSEAIKSQNMTEVARKHGVNFNLVAKWKQHFTEHGAKVFETTKDKERENMKKQIGRLEQMLGKKEVELNLLKNFSDFYESRNGT